MPFAICRIQKIKSWRDLSGSTLHTARRQDTPNADKSVNNIRLIGYDNQTDLAKLFQQKIGDQKIRSNAVLGVEMLLSASPDYFHPDNPSPTEIYDQKRLDEFVVAAKDWLLKQHKDNIIRAELHLDESTPHIHAYIVPLDSRGKLNYRGMYGGSKYKLCELQDSFANAVKHLGLERGIKGSKATHTKIKDYYTDINRDFLHLSLEETLPIPRVNELAADYQERVKESLQPRLDIINHQLIDRERVRKEKEKLAQTALLLKRDRQQLEQRIQQLEQEITSWKAQADLLRDLPLSEVAYQLGLFEDKKGQHRWKGGGHIINIVDSKFYDFGIHQKGGGGAIDLVMHINSCNFKEAVVWLNDRFSAAEIVRAINHHIRSQVEEISKDDLNLLFTPPIADENQWREVQRYLNESRKLPKSLITTLHAAGLIYADKNANAVFLMRNFAGETTGAFLRGTIGENNTYMGFASGTKRTSGWFHLTVGGQADDSIACAILVKSPIEALSLATLISPQEKTLYLVADSKFSVPFSEFFSNIPTIIAAYDNDQAGDETAKQIQQVLPQLTRLRPKAKDWNEELTRYINIAKLDNQIQR